MGPVTLTEQLCLKGKRGHALQTRELCAVRGPLAADVAADSELQKELQRGSGRAAQGTGRSCGLCVTQMERGEALPGKAVGCCCGPEVFLQEVGSSPPAAGQTSHPLKKHVQVPSARCRGHVCGERLAHCHSQSSASVHTAGYTSRFFISSRKDAV